MFSLKNKYTLEKPIHKIDFIKYSSSSQVVWRQLTIQTRILQLVSQEKMHTYVYKIVS